MNINWYPGHMKKTLDSIRENLKLVDIAAELIDSRIPISSRNPKIDDLLEGKPRIIILTKMDMANPIETNRWIEYFKKRGLPAVAIDAKTGKNIEKIETISRIALKEKFLRDEQKNIKSKKIRMMIVGIPNVGKSTLINRLSGKSSTKVGNKPGVTRSNQWIRTNSSIELLDTPGALWPKFEDERTGLNLAFTGAIKDEILDKENLAFELLKQLIEIDPSIIEKRYKIDTHEKSTIEVMDEIGKKRGTLLKGNEIDYAKVSRLILDEFRKGMLGVITLECLK